MRLTIEQTSKIVEINGVPARVWEGETTQGVRVHCLITRVAVKEGEPPWCYERFEAELKECRPPSIESGQAFPVRLIL
jgi:hypothetical protein